MLAACVPKDDGEQDQGEGESEGNDGDPGDGDPGDGDPGDGDPGDGDGDLGQDMASEDPCPTPGPGMLPDPPELDPPRFVDTSYIALEDIGWVGKYRSTIGIDYSDDFEHCRAMKHYFYPLDEVAWDTIEIRSPVAGEVIAVENEMFGVRVQIRSSDYPDYDFLLFAVNLDSPLTPGAMLMEGEVLGTHFGVETYPNIAVAVNVEDQLRLVSWFDVMSDTQFMDYTDRGAIMAREDVIITKEDRDADPLCCTNGHFDGEELLEDWVAIDPEPDSIPEFGLAAPPQQVGDLGFRRRTDQSH